MQCGEKRLKSCGWGVSGDAGVIGLTSGDEWLARLIRSSTKGHIRDIDVATVAPAEGDVSRVAAMLCGGLDATWHQVTAHRQNGARPSSGVPSTSLTSVMTTLFVIGIVCGACIYY
jgi:hypothetical protein